MKKNIPYFELSKKKLFEKLNFLKKYFDEVSYSYKTNNIVGNILNEKESCFISVHNFNELKKIKNKKKVWFFLLANSKEDLLVLFEKYKIRNFVVDNIFDFENLKSFIEKENYNINLLLRVKIYENTMSYGKHYYFGMKINEVKKLINENFNHKNIKKLGVHIHRKTQNISEWNIKEEIVETLGKDILKKISIFNLGGGLPSNYRNSYDNEVKNIFREIKNLKKIFEKYNIKFIVEPGRFLAADCIKLISHIKLIEDNVVFLDVSIFNGLLDTIALNIKLKVLGENLENKGNRYLLKGISPDSQDIIRYCIYLEKKLKVGDKIIFLNAGAYNYHTTLCSLDEIKTKIIE